MYVFIYDCVTRMYVQLDRAWRQISPRPLPDHYSCGMTAVRYQT